MVKLDKYAQFCGAKNIEDIRTKAENLGDKHILNINSTYQGGGVAEILNRLVPLMNSVGVNFGWRIFPGTPDFFLTSKKFTNAVMGDKIHFTENKRRLYESNAKKFSAYTHVHHDAVIIHDIQPLPLIKFYKKRQPWIWRCHSDIETPNKQVYSYLKKFIGKYDHSVFLSKKFMKKDLKMPQTVMAPSIDPLSIKNKPLGDEVIRKYLRKAGIPLDKPIICQVSRFDKWKDPRGVIEIHKDVKKKKDCTLVLVGSMALDDPLGQETYEKVVEHAKKSKDVKIILNASDILVNALQRKSAVVVQKSIKEGFGLTVTEALWKGTPVVAGNVGGISDQIINGKSGYLLRPNDHNGYVGRILHLMNNKKIGKKMGKVGMENVRKKFLITTHMAKWIDVLDKTINHKK